MVALFGCQQYDYTSEQVQDLVPHKGMQNQAPDTGTQEITPSVTVQDQQLRTGVVTIEQVDAAQQGWIVVHRQENNQPGAVIGHAAVSEGENRNVGVSVDQNMATDTLYAMLHADLGQGGVYEFPGADSPVQIDGQTVVQPFNVQLQETVEAENLVEMRDNQFVPETLEIDVGDTVVWQNMDGYLHTVTGFGVDRNVQSGDTFSHTFDQQGTYDYECIIHPGMSGTVIIGQGAIQQETDDAETQDTETQDTET